MNRFRIIFVLLLFTLSVSAQTITLVGYIKNSFTYKAIPDVTVSLLHADSTLIKDSIPNMAMDNETMYFITDFPRVKQNIIIKVTHPDYETAYLPYEVKNFGRNQQIDLPVILMDKKIKKSTNEKTVDLKEVVATATKIKMYQRGDTVVYDATAFNIPQGSMLDELIKSLPGAELKPDGQIFINGEKVDYLMLNANEFFRGNNQVMLRNLPYYTIKNLKAYHRTTDMSAYLGRDKEKKDYVLDVQLKKEYKQGYLGNIEAGVGTDKRYMSRAFALRFTDRSRLSLYGNMNNINDDGSYMQDGQWAGGNEGNGIFSTKQIGGEYYIKLPDKGFNNTLQANIKGIHKNVEERASAQAFLSNGKTVFSESMLNSTNRINSLQIRDWWQITKKWWVSGNIAFSRERNKLNMHTNELSSMTSALFPDTLTYNDFNQFQDLYNTDFSTKLEALRKLAWGDNILFNAHVSYSSGEDNLYGQHQLVQVSTPNYRHDYAKATRHDFALKTKMEYSVPFINGPVVSLGYQPGYKKKTLRDNVFRLDNLKEWSASEHKSLMMLPTKEEMDASCMDVENTYNYRNTLFNHPITLTVDWEKHTKEENTHHVIFEFPVTFNHETMSYVRNMIDTTAHRNYTTINPQISYNSIWHNEMRRFRISNSLLTSAGDFLMMMPYRDSTNPLSIRVGNEHLKQTWVYQTNASLSLKSKKMPQLFAIAGSVTVYGNRIVNGFTFNPSNGVYTYRPENVKGNWEAYGKVDFSLLFGKGKRMKLDNHADYNFVHSVDIAASSDEQSMYSKVNTSLWNENLTLSYMGKYLTVDLFSGIALRHSTSVANLFDPINTTDFNVGIRGYYLIPWMKVSIKTDFTYYNRHGYSDFNNSQLIWNASLSKSLCKGKLILSAYAYDLLKQRENTQYIINAQGQTITWKRTLPNYAMLRLQWNFNYNPKSKTK